MRALLTLPTPGHTYTRDELWEVLVPTTWVPNTRNLASDAGDADWITDRVAHHLRSLPEGVRRHVETVPQVFIQVGHSVEGIVSVDRENVVMVRLFETADSIEAIKDAVNTVASRLPAAFQMDRPGESLQLQDEVIIRQSNDGRTLAKGKIVTPHTLRFRPYLHTERPREARLLVWLGWLAAAAFALGVVLTAWNPLSLWLVETKGYSERLASAVVVAILTTLINLVFEYRDWRNERTEVVWLFG